MHIFLSDQRSVLFISKLNVLPLYSNSWKSKRDIYLYILRIEYVKLLIFLLA